MAYSVLMLHYLLSKLLFFMLSLYALKNYAMFYFLSMIIPVIFPLWYCYYLNQVMLKQTLVTKNPQLLNFVIGT